MRKWAPCSTSGAEGWRGARALLQDAEAAAAKLAHYFEEVDTVMHSLERQLFSAAEDFLNLGCNEPAVLVRMVQVRLCAPSLLNLGCNEPAWCRCVCALRPSSTWAATSPHGAGACVRSVLPQPGLQRARRARAHGSGACVRSVLPGAAQPHSNREHQPVRGNEREAPGLGRRTAQH
jgi:hypothetical protein